MRQYPEGGPFPLGIVLDDFERLSKLSLLTASLAQGHDARMSFMMLTDGMQALQNKVWPGKNWKILSAVRQLNC